MISSRARRGRAPALMAIAVLGVAGLAACTTSDDNEATSATTAAPATSATTAASAATGGATTTAAASAGATTSAAAGGAAPANVKTDKGVTDKEITLGVLTDQSSIYVVISTSVVQGNQMFWDDQNAAGGVCGRQVRLEIKDHGYNVENAQKVYPEVKDSVLAFQHVVGSPINAALLESYKADNVVAMPVSWASSLLATPQVVEVGTTYDVEMIDALDWALNKTGNVKAGDTIGAIYADSEYGKNGFAGMEYAADQLGLNLEAVAVKPTDTDISGAVLQLNQKGAKWVFATISPGQTTSALNTITANGFDMRIVGSNPTWDPGQIAGPAADAYRERYYFVSSYAPFASPEPGPTKVRAEFDQKYAGSPEHAAVMFGYAQGEVMYRLLDAACKSGDLTRAGVLAAKKTLASIDTQGLVAELDYTTEGGIPARQVYVAVANPDVAGSLEVVQPLFEADIAKTYKPGG